MIPTLVKTRIRRALGPNAVITRLDRLDAFKRECDECGEFRVQRFLIQHKTEQMYFCDVVCIEKYFPDYGDLNAETLSEFRTEFFGPTVNFTNKHHALFGWLNTTRYTEFDF